jgi:hypothetical protein
MQKKEPLKATLWFPEAGNDHPEEVIEEQLFLRRVPEHIGPILRRFPSLSTR